ncbi:hypothetical protein [Streptomyces acidicola]|uniref:hypothetical protein n=1 Tax=Streptomyces acidicola TaxID=2596892 RepID=UPI003412A597
MQSALADVTQALLLPGSPSTASPSSANPSGQVITPRSHGRPLCLDLPVAPFLELRRAGRNPGTSTTTAPP